jgi:hypothetical protein
MDVGINAVFTGFLLHTCFARVVLLVVSSTHDKISV